MSTTSRLMWANHDLALAKVRLASGIGSQAEVDKALVRLKYAKECAIEAWDQETEILKAFEDEHRPEPEATPILKPMNADEHIQGRYVVDQENKSRRNL